MNERIRVREVRVIGENSEQLGVMPPEEALARAREVGLDLVEVAANSRPPVCRIMDYGRFKYEQKKKKASASKNAHSASLKEIKLRPGTDQHDLDFKLNNARKFLMEGDKVKVTVMFRGREMVHQQRGRQQLQMIEQQMLPIGKLENPPRMEGRFMSMILAPDRDAVTEAKAKAKAEAEQAAAEAEEAAEAADKADEKLTKAERRARKQQRVEDARLASEAESASDEAPEESESAAE